MTVSVKDQLKQLSLLQHSLLLATRNSAGFRNVQALLVSAVRQGLITNETQQAVLEACQPLRLGSFGEPAVSTKMVREIVAAIRSEINQWRRVAG